MAAGCASSCNLAGGLRQIDVCLERDRERPTGGVQRGGILAASLQRRYLIE